MIALGSVIGRCFIGLGGWLGSPLWGFLSRGRTIRQFLLGVVIAPTLVLATMSTDGNPNPNNRTKIIWGLLVSGIALSLLMAGGLKAVQTATIVFALPFSLVLVLMAIALVRAVQQDWHAHDLRERQLRKEVEKLLKKS